MEPSVREFVRRRAGDLCEYCRLPQSAAPYTPFHVEHIVADQHGGSGDWTNLAWSCHRCNAYKDPNLSTLADDDMLTALFHPRRDNWDEHFSFVGAEIVGLTAVGRATLRLLRFNDPYRLELREECLREVDSEETRP